MHQQINEGISNHLEVHKEIKLFLKVKIKDKDLPLKFIFHYRDEKRKDIQIFLSPDFKDPKEN